MLAGSVYISLFIILILIIIILDGNKMPGSDGVLVVSIIILIYITVVFYGYTNKLSKAENIKADEIIALQAQIHELESKAIAAGIATRVPVKVIEKTTFMFNSDMLAESPVASLTEVVASQTETNK